jgi:O-antigen ligase
MAQYIRVKKQSSRKRPLTLLQKLALGILLFVLILSPVFFGSVHVWAYSLFSMAAFTATGLLIIQDMLFSLKAKDHTPPSPWRTPADLWILLFAAVFALQLLPLPESVVEILSPHLAQIRHKVQAITDQNLPHTLSAIPYATKISALLFVAYSCVFYSLVRLGGDRSRHKKLAYTLLITGICIALYGLVEKLSGHNHILWWEHEFGSKRSFRVFGTFINPDHMALYMEMMLCLGMGLIFSMYQPGQGQNDQGFWKRFKKTVVQDHETGNTWQKAILLLFFVSLILLTLLLTGSRGGIFSAAVGICVFVLAVYRKNRDKRVGWVLLVLLGLTLFFGARTGLMPVWERFTELTPENLVQHRRVEHNLAALEMVKDYPVLGSGMGTFEQAYPPYQPADDQRLRTHLHCDWLQMATEAGVVGFLIVLAGYIVVLTFLWRTVQSREDRLSTGLALAALSALVSVGVHSLMDFGLRMPANAWTLAAIVALGVGGRGRSEKKVRSEE